MVLFSGQPALSYDGTMHYSFDYAQQIHYPHYSQQVGPLFLKLHAYKAVHIVHHVLLIIFKIFQTAHTMTLGMSLRNWYMYIVDYNIEY